MLLYLFILLFVSLYFQLKSLDQMYGTNNYISVVRNVISYHVSYPLVIEHILILLIKTLYFALYLYGFIVLSFSYYSQFYRIGATIVREKQPSISITMTTSIYFATQSESII